MPGKVDKNGYPIPIDLDQYLNYILENFRFSSMFQADRVLKKHYETVFGVFDHRPVSTKNLRPLSGQAILEGNDIGENYEFNNLLDQYEDLDIYNYTKLTFSEYCTLSPDQMKQLRVKADARKRRLEAAQHAAAEESQRAANALQNQLKASSSSPGANPRNDPSLRGYT